MLSKDAQINRASGRCRNGKMGFWAYFFDKTNGLE